MRRQLAAFLVSLSMVTGYANAEAELLDWSDLQGWTGDDHAAALSVFLVTCGDLKKGDWPAICALAKTTKNPRTFFESVFRPVLITDGNDPLFTGYYEPELTGSRTQTERFKYPLHSLPSEIVSGKPWLTREEIEKTGALSGQGLELAYLDDPVEKFFLQIQGSGRIKLEDGGSMRVGYGGKNGHPYRSVGKELVRRGEFEPHQVSAKAIRRWVAENPAEGTTLLWHNTSYVFFREVSKVPADKGPLGAMNRSITDGRTLAVDPDYVPLGAPVWLEKGGKIPIQRLMVAQDTGSAIKGAQRGDIFFGTGDTAGKIAGTIRDRGRLIVLLPISEAIAITEQVK